MSSASPTKSNEMRCSLVKNIRLNIKSKYIPQDFFSPSISQQSSWKKRIQNQSLCNPENRQLHNDSSCHKKMQKHFELKDFELLRKRLIKIKDQTLIDLKDKTKKVSLKKRLNSKQSIHKINNKQKISVKDNDENKEKQKGSKKLMDYMQKMKNLINIDIKFQQDDFIVNRPIYVREQYKLSDQDIDTQDSPKPLRQRPKSEINSRQRLPSKQKIIKSIQKKLALPLKTKKQLIQSSLKKQSCQKVEKTQRYNKFIQIPLNQDGMLTFYGSPKQKCPSNYNCQKYKIRTSLPKLER